MLNAAYKRWEKKYPDKVKEKFRRKVSRHRIERNVHNKVRYYVKKGVIVRHPCIVCGSKRLVEGHHEDYNKPLDVIWLCQSHHRDIHEQKKAVNY